MAIADPAVPLEETGPVILALPERVTEELLIALGRENPGYRFETTADGRLVVSPLTGTFASGGEAELILQIGIWNKKHRLGRVTPSSGGITLADGAIKGPDATFISKKRIAALSPKRKKRAFEQIAPDAVFELLSPSDKSSKYTIAKCEEYIETGSGVAVLLNPSDRSVTLFRKGQEPAIVRDAGKVTIGDEMPGFTLDAQAVFEACEPDNDIE
jgi:Uma2 family endonuclease